MSVLSADIVFLVVCVCVSVFSVLMMLCFWAGVCSVVCVCVSVFSVLILLCFWAGVGSAVVDNYLYVVGGHSGSSYLSAVQRYDPITDSWHDSSGMMYCRCNFGLTAL